MAVLNSADIIVQLGLLSDDNLSLLKENQTLVGVFNPHINKEKIENLSKKNINIFSLEMSAENNKSSVNGYTFFPS